MEEVLLRVSSQFKVVLVTGPRQVGKTTMMKTLMEGTSRKYVSLDDMTARQLAKNDPGMFIKTYSPPVFIDEVQYAPELFSYIKMQVDERQQNGDYWLSGSQIFRLMRGVSESLAGRVGLENFVVSEVKKGYFNSGKMPYLHYYRDKDNKEIDLLWEVNGTLYPLEIKKTSSPDVRLTKVFGLLEKSGKVLGNGGIVCLYDDFLPLDRENFIIPIRCI